MTTTIKSAVMVHHNPIYTIYSDNRIYNTKTKRWVTIFIDTDDDGYQSWRFGYQTLNGTRTHECFAVALLCYFVSEQEFFDPLMKADHINRNSLDNRLENLRWATNLQQALNRGMFKNNTSGFVGVCFHKNMKKWRAKLVKNSKSNHIGYFDNKYDAAIAFRKKHIQAFGVDSQYYPDKFKVKQSELNIKKLK